MLSPGYIYMSEELYYLNMKTIQILNLNLRLRKVSFLCLNLFMFT